MQPLSSICEGRQHSITSLMLLQFDKDDLIKLRHIEKYFQDQQIFDKGGVLFLRRNLIEQGLWVLLYKGLGQ